jgi:formyltetrahydrofolate deformylase
MVNRYVPTFKPDTSYLENRARLLISCPDQNGIVAAVSQFLYEYGANIIQSDQYATAPTGGMFFIRIEFDVEQLESRLATLEKAFAPIAKRFEMEARFERAVRKKRLAIFVSKEDHALLELLWQWQSGELYADIAVVVSNHTIMKDLVESYGIPFVHIPVTPETKAEAEAAQMAAIEGIADVVVLARYMQIISPKLLAAYHNRIINIHHSFLPAFIGGNPYAQAFNRGVKIIGATSHYVTEELDGGPIIEQDVQRVSHRDTVDDLKRIGRHIERTVLARAVQWHVEDRILVFENKTIVFN